ncbi:2-oxo-4-hydroxy-4-carboxy-5-ureidoimidazoline decarboxylase [Streptomyces sp. TRM 70351]|uniref:2-oxo-4-hydroxy-4-carboxy-5-ureidoimidazoline decarboxylase n=1 Tax=Streptomyces sp. TRM 70351 TaxID=3116552 RepID=UPI002E7ACD82|nr:2-oxo-4-hydroxy-4-carboxy-5-ureidoimidazoline decarboxylase [Streptomyces sp. TRM 70351]MEE1927929.1 2-oxo-4-hydroxy-4-carboxy-5-ureidoimidazoline decarboxylase [Streptomyces sp. TRM 70351]
MRLSAQRGPRTPLGRLNDAPAEDAAAALLTCCGSERWARLLAGHRPYPDADTLLAAAEEAGYDLTDTDVSEALAAESAHHPLTEGPGALAAHTALRAAHAAYESRFGYAFVICLDALPPAERLDAVLEAIRFRLAHRPEEERAVAAEELRRLALARLRALVAGSGLTRRSPSVPD